MLEVLISGGLFVMALALCGELAVVGIRSRNQSMNKNGEFRANLTLLHQLQVDLKETQPGVDSSALVLRLPGPDGVPRVVAWNIESTQLRRIIYMPDFNPALPATHVPKPAERTLSTQGIGNFTLQLEPPGQNYGSKILRIRMDCLQPALQKIDISQRLEL